MAGGVPVLPPQLWVTVDPSPRCDMPLFHRSRLIPSLFPCSRSVLWSQLDPSSQLDPGSQLTPLFPACSEAGLPVGEGFLQSSFRFPRWTFEASGITILASL